MPPERGDCIDYQQRVSTVSKLAQTSQVLKNAGRSFRMHDRERAGLTRIERGFDVRPLDRVTPLSAHDYGLASGAFYDVAHAFAEDTVNANHYFIAGLDDVYQSRFHAGASGRGDRNRHAVFCLEHVSKHLLDVVHALEKERIEMSEHRRRHCFENAIFNRARPRSQQHAPGRLKILVVSV